MHKQWTTYVIPYDSHKKGDWLCTVDSAFNELGYNEISEFLNIPFFKIDFFLQRYYYEGGQDFFFHGPLNFAK